MTHDISPEVLATNLHRVRERIADAQSKYGVGNEQVELIAITKYVDSSVARTLFELGCKSHGESRPQLLCQKQDELADLDIEWHLVGHLQTNKIKSIIGRTHLIHSTDSLRLLDELNRQAERVGSTISCLLEVHISDEQSKQGFKFDELPAAFEYSQTLEHLSVRGLMGKAQLDGDEKTVRQQFSALREARDRLASSSHSSQTFHHLSMGMSDDFEWAIAEGATMVRIGSVLFA